MTFERKNLGAKGKSLRICVYPNKFFKLKRLNRFWRNFPVGNIAKFLSKPNLRFPRNLEKLVIKQSLVGHFKTYSSNKHYKYQTSNKRNYSIAPIYNYQKFLSQLKSIMFQWLLNRTIISFSAWNRTLDHAPVVKQSALVKITFVCVWFKLRKVRDFICVKNAYCSSLL